MDNGHTKANGQVNGIFSGPDQYQSLVENPYFTAGEGNTPAETPTAPEENLNQENWGQSPENPAPKEAPKNPYELGQITPIAPINPNQPAGVPAPAPAPAPLEMAQNYNPTNIRTTGDHLEKSAIPEVDNTIAELNQTGNLNNFYDEIRGTDEKPGMMQTNLKNSFNRELGQDQAGGGK